MGLALGFGLGFGLLCVSLILCGSVAPEDMFCSLKMAQDDEQKCRMLLKDLAQNWQWSHSLTFSWPKQATCPSSISVGWRNIHSASRGRAMKICRKKSKLLQRFWAILSPALDSGIPYIQLWHWVIPKSFPFPISNFLTPRWWNFITFPQSGLPMLPRSHKAQERAGLGWGLTARFLSL